MSGVPLLACKQCSVGFWGRSAESTAFAKQWNTAGLPVWVARPRAQRRAWCAARHAHHFILIGDVPLENPEAMLDEMIRYGSSVY